MKRRRSFWSAGTRKRTLPGRLDQTGSFHTEDNMQEANQVYPFSAKTQLGYLIGKQYQLGRSCSCYTPPSTDYEGRVYYVQEITAKLPNGRRVTVEAMYSGTGLTEPEQFTAKELANFRRLAFAMNVLVIESSPLLED